MVPSASLSESYDDNIYRTTSQPRGDFISMLAPAIAAKSDWNANELDFNVNSNIGRHAAHPREDWDDWSAGTSGRLDVLRELFLAGSGAISQLHEDRSSPDDRAGFEPTHYRLGQADAGAHWNLGDLDLRLDGGLHSYGYENGRNAAGIIDNSGRNRIETDTVLRAGYEYLPRNEVFLRLGYGNRSYQTAVDIDGYHRGGDGFSMAVGSGVDLGGLVMGEFYIGYLDLEFRDQRFSSVGTPIFEGRFFWEATPLITVVLSGARTVTETSVAGAASYIATRVKLQAEYELLRSLIISSQSLYENAAYADLTRVDDTYQEELAITYLLDRNFKLKASENYNDRRSNLPNVSYSGNTILLGMTASY